MTNDVNRVTRASGMESLDHHREMSFAGIAVFHHLLNRATRSRTKGTVGLCKGLGTRALAEDMGKSRDAVKRAVQELENLRYIRRTPEGILVLNFTGDEPQKHPQGDRKTVRTGKQSGPLISPPPDRETVPPRTGKQSPPGLKSGPPNRSGHVGDDLHVGDGAAPAAPPVEKSNSRLLWWNPETRELECEPEFALRLEELFPVRRELLRAAWVKFGHWIGTPKRDPASEARRRELIARDDLSDWLENRLREDFAKELAAPRNLDEQLSDEARDRQRGARGRRPR